MPKRGAFALGLTALALVLLLNFQTPSLSPASATGPGTGGTGERTVNGPVVGTRFGSVQVEVTLDGTKIVDITALQLPNGDRRTDQISSYVEPILRTEALQAQSANIDGISGATYTSNAYARSLQAALDSAGI